MVAYRTISSLYRSSEALLGQHVSDLGCSQRQHGDAARDLAIPAAAFTYKAAFSEDQLHLLDRPCICQERAIQFKPKVFVDDYQLKATTGSIRTE
ncbi:uncharacterized protein PHALS_07117 [Plasmopara halstedii]|uniref:Uncharacterized protein n=1 Tax=Plasmopara halstedii TaxID=4781 RepID=A0A0P1B3N0_PLAHL|nr:uncharacterized protein PHALS_07117 [Plasmopara halstedii]CEG49350.1 hypothetical protein PHALS_07117 [Plasmopara halstedii]|eukprot:XP_024585719.1 hypothetical protein PHALS_07117 [Plasmopara halstedii]